MKKSLYGPNIVNQKLRFFWVVALRPEANALIKKFNLRSFSNYSKFPIYLNHNNGHALVISGVGSIKAAVATMYLNNALNPGQFAAWINIGIAGHFQGPVGKLFQAIKVVNSDNGDAFFPGLRFPRLVKAAELCTVSLPESDFALPVLYDMEAAGFCAIAPSLSCNELTFVLKIVSDTSEQSHSLVTKKLIADLFKQNSPKIDAFLKAISQIVAQEEARLGNSAINEEIKSLLHFTETNWLRFQKIYKKWYCVFPNMSVIELAKQASSAKDLIKKLEFDIASEAEGWKLR